MYHHGNHCDERSDLMTSYFDIKLIIVIIVTLNEFLFSSINFPIRQYMRIIPTMYRFQSNSQVIQPIELSWVCANIDFIGYGAEIIV